VSVYVNISFTVIISGGVLYEFYIIIKCLFCTIIIYILLYMIFNIVAVTDPNVVWPEA